MADISLWATVLSPIIGVIAIIVALVIAKGSSRDAEKQIKAVYNLLDVFVAAQNPNMIAAMQQYEQQLTLLDNQIQEAEEKFDVVNPFFGRGARIDDIEYIEKKKCQKQHLDDLLRKREELITSQKLIQSYLNKVMK